MTPEKCQAVRASFARMKPNQAQFSEDFLTILFTMASDLRPMFRDDLSFVKQHLPFVIEGAIGLLEDLDTLEANMHDLALRHRARNAAPVDFPVVGRALLMALEKNVPHGLTPFEVEAWQRAYDILSDTMIKIAYPRTHVTAAE